MNDADRTLTTAAAAATFAAAPVLGLTILWHPSLERIGEQCLGPGWGGAIELSRFTPLFCAPGGEAGALGHRAISRSPLRIRVDAGGAVELLPADSRMTLEVNGAPLSAPLKLAPHQLDQGVVLGLGAQVFVCLHWMRCLPRPANVPGVLGVGSAAIALREAITQSAAAQLPVLLLGETGCGKDVAARAIHHLSARAARPFVAVNMATLSESLAAADLFGAVKGAYTGAQANRRGWFEEAGDGTLFLDEIGDTPGAVQAMLLRVLESGEYRPLGAAADAVSRARLIAATDQDLDSRGFSQALRRRMEAFVIRVPALRERREDIGVLARHFLRTYGQLGDCSLPTALVSGICNNNWPGNIRQLAHAMHRIALDLHHQRTPTLDETRSARQVAPALPANDGHGAMARPDAPRPRRKPADVTPQDLVAAMEQGQWQIRSAARHLGISRPSVYKLLQAHPHIRLPAHIPAAEIRAALQACAGDVTDCASRLMTPSEALRRHLSALDRAPPAD
ncbi:two-component system nitrogen regulation response regulator GlnG [Duganella sp. SG902]|uniref:sigma 54-interacting transcriptional regulator n=1 Tax=Duganella sp. SG902 TaxID=2587016 RepID=UPI00159D3F3A|nr:sigma 54-interacting transcriptional regulator [Duganella sp. SG902]NVM78415.1 two-component system nitrogen regulation response regulator GlnG [Duganella sp. SG902]